jgi:phosphoesterase RecJ-like protein
MSMSVERDQTQPEPASPTPVASPTPGDQPTPVAAGQPLTIAERFQAAAAILAQATDVTLFGHVNPDADAFGSAIGLATVLRDLGADVRVSFGAPLEVPESLRHLDSAGLFVPADQVPAVPPLLVVLDSGSLDRLGPLVNRVAATRDSGGHVIVIDHHVSNTRFGTLNVVDDRAEATAAMVLRLVDALDVPLTEPAARALYAGLLTDTSSFRRATPDTHLAAARLLATGVNAEAVARPLLDSHPFGWLGMLSKVLGRAELDRTAVRGLGLVHAIVTADDAAGLRQEDVESVINIIRASEEAEVAAVLKEAGPGRWTGSLRAVSRVDVSAVARALGGGGHRLAAGFTTEGSAEQVLARLKAELDAAPIAPGVSTQGGGVSTEPQRVSTLPGNGSTEAAGVSTLPGGESTQSGGRSAEAGGGAAGADRLSTAE